MVVANFRCLVEGLFDILVVPFLTRRLAPSRDVVCHLSLQFLFGYYLTGLAPQVALRTHKYYRRVRANRPDLCHPILDVVERVAVGHRDTKHEAVCLAVADHSDIIQVRVAGSVVYLEPQRLLIECH